MSIYRSAEHEARVMAHYDAWLARYDFPLESVSVDTRAGRTHLLVTGPEDAPPLMLVHGFSTHALFMVDICAVALRERYRCWFVDVPGNPGRSEGELPDFNDGAFGRWMEEVLDGIGVERVGLIGVSMGALASLHTCAQIGARVSRAVFIVPAGFVETRFSWSMLKLVVRQLLLLRRPNRANARRFIAASARADTIIEDHIAEAIEVVFGNLRPRMSDTPLPRPLPVEALRDFHGASLVIAGEDDSLFPGRAVIARAQELFAEPQTLLLADGHTGAMSSPSREQVLEHVTRFLTETDGTLAG